ncbi:MAG: hypothetical protein ACU843_09720 [Gammaproteobacteria bacterium]
MKKIIKRPIMNKFFAAFMFASSISGFSGNSLADPLVVGDDDSIQAVLAAHKDKRVIVKLNSGEELSGKVGNVTGKLVVLQELAGKEFYDAAISLKKIAAVIVRAREQ